MEILIWVFNLEINSSKYNKIFLRYFNFIKIIILIFNLWRIYNLFHSIWKEKKYMWGFLMLINLEINF